MLEIIGRRNSSNVMTVMWCVGELNLDYTRRNAGGSFGGLDTTDYRAMNPNGVVPTLIDSGHILWESNVIARYLAAKHGAGSLWPEDPYKRALADQWMEWVKTTFYPTFLPVFFNMIRTAPETRDEAAIQRGVEASAKTLGALDTHLQKHSFVGGEQLTIGDLPLGPVIYRYMNLDISRPSLPGVESWYQRLCDRPAYQKHAMIPFGSSFAQWQQLEKDGADIQ